MRSRHFVLTAIITTLFCNTLQLFAGGSSNHTYTDPAVRAKIEPLPGQVIADFEDPKALKNITYQGDIIKLELNTITTYVKEGNSSLKITCSSKKASRPPIIIQMDAPKTLSDYQAIKFWLYVSPETAQYCFGRYDIEIFLGKDNIRKSWPAVKPGWYQYIWDLKDAHEMPDFDTIRFVFGPFMEGYNHAELYLDDFTLVPMDQVAPNSDLAQVATQDKSWSRRYSALKHLASSGTKDSLKVFVKACGDKSPAIRTFAVDIMNSHVKKHGPSTIPDLKKGMADKNWRVRLDVFELITEVENELGNWPQTVFNKALIDENYYIREMAINHFLTKKLTKSNIADKLIPSLNNPNNQIPAIRTLSEIGPRATNALPPLMEILRNSKNDLMIRCWALRAVWAIDEDLLMPKDWALAINLEPWQVHRHLLNMAMDRLEIAGNKAVPALTSLLHSKNPEVIARTCVILAAIGTDAVNATSELKRVSQDQRWYLAYEAQQALKKILPNYTAPTIEKPETFINSDVTVTHSGKITTISNGLLEMVFEDGDINPGPQVIRTPGGKNLVDASWLPAILAFKYSKAPNMIERQWIQRIFGVPFPRTQITEVVSATADKVDYMIKFVGDEEAFLEWEFHYVLRKGDSGIYNYFVIRNTSGQEIPKETTLGNQAGIGRINHLFALTWDTYDHAFLHDKLKAPGAFFNYPNEYSAEEFPDIYQSAFRQPDGNLVAKHEWHNYELLSHVNGFSGPNGGFWTIYPSYDFFGDSMPRHLNTQIHEHLFVPMWEGKYYSGVTAHVTQEWEKTYGPIFIYLNEGENSEEMWVDAKRQAESEKAKWPYTWLKSKTHHDRGSVQGKVQIANGASPQGTYVVLSNPNDPVDPDQISLWMRNCGAYNYWTQVNQDGSFNIKNVHSGTYGLYLFKPGIHGELDHGQITITKGQATNMGNLILTPEHKGNLVWQIGIPDGGTQEFQNGRNYHQWDTYLRYREDFPDDVHYTVGQSDWTKDWNYLHPATVQGEWTPVTWTIDFNLDELPKNDHLLTIVCAGRNATANVLLNGQKIGRLNNIRIGSNHARTAPYGELTQREFTISPELLKDGKNKIELSFDLSVKVKEGWHEAPANTVNLSWTSWLAYDFIRFEELN